MLQLLRPLQEKTTSFLFLLLISDQTVSKYFFIFELCIQAETDQSTPAAKRHQDWWLLSVLSSVTSLRADMHIAISSFQIKFIYVLVPGILLNFFSMQLNNNTFQAYTHL